MAFLGPFLAKQLHSLEFAKQLIGNRALARILTVISERKERPRSQTVVYKR